MGRVVAQHPAATVEEHEDGQGAFHASGADDGQLDFLAVGFDGFLADVGCRQFQLHTGLGAGQHRAGIFRCKGFQRLATTGGQGFKEGLGIAFHTRTAGGESLGHGEGEKAACDCAADRFHGGFPQSMNCFVVKKFAR
ncbi:hypothetical protein D9M73_191630 [compost metagenome]